MIPLSFTGRSAGVSAMPVVVRVAVHGAARVVRAPLLRALPATVPLHRDLRGKGACQLPCMPREHASLR